MTHQHTKGHIEFTFYAQNEELMNENCRLQQLFLHEMPPPLPNASGMKLNCFSVNDNCHVLLLRLNKTSAHSLQNKYQVSITLQIGTVASNFSHTKLGMQAMTAYEYKDPLMLEECPLS